MPWYGNNAWCMLSVTLFKCVFIRSACVYITSECHPPLSGDWPSAGEYGGCAIWMSSECSCYLLHPPSSNKVN